MMFCPECGNLNMRHTKEPMLEPYKGKKYVVPNIERWVCDQCGNDIMTADMADKLSKSLHVMSKQLNNSK